MSEPLNDRVLCRVCGELVWVYDDKTPEQATCPEHCPDHEFKYDRGERGHRCIHCGVEPPPDFYYDD